MGTQGKQKRAGAKDDFATNRILAVFSLAFLLIIGLMLIYRLVDRTGTMFQTIAVLYVIGGLAAAGVVAGIVWSVLCARRGVDRSQKVLNGGSVAVASAIFAVCAFVAARFGTTGIETLYIFVPVAAVLILIYLIYPRDFFAIALISASAGFFMWFLSASNAFVGLLNLPAGSNYFSGRVLLGIAAIVLLAAAAVAVQAVGARSGVVELGGKKIHLMRRDANYRLIYLTVALAALAVIAAVLFGAVLAYYLVFVLFAYLFVMAVYYTVKMM